MDVLAPCPGRLLPLTQTPDPVFAGEMVGPGVAIDPDPGPTTVVSPIAGRVVKIHPHAFVVLGEGGVGVLVHLGIDTVKLDGQGFEMLAQQGANVVAGEPMVRWDPATITGDGISTMVPVVVMDRPKGSVPAPDERHVVPGDVLFEVV
ncbi:PTS glucose transporter subunit IIA [Nocardioides mangrovicus]|uniref:PTS glucose transporter subunit IIA n=1 Tax=Nocardioides mangrovicus TaxID=2478913 RepID=A0A3L8P2R8_9ACTN|nr:PTS glucose transporter subunit IIA [Nocardioides mangrovicus]RLV48859.1 PTS glucose transporter subunit IIA [Nocardioides mangrovicus]